MAEQNKRDKSKLRVARFKTQKMADEDNNGDDWAVVYTDSNSSIASSLESQSSCTSLYDTSSEPFHKIGKDENAGSSSSQLSEHGDKLQDVQGDDTEDDDIDILDSAPLHMDTSYPPEMAQASLINLLTLSKEYQKLVVEDDSYKQNQPLQQSKSVGDSFQTMRDPCEPDCLWPMQEDYFAPESTSPSDGKDCTLDDDDGEIDIIDGGDAEFLSFNVLNLPSKIEQVEHDPDYKFDTKSTARNLIREQHLQTTMTTKRDLYSMIKRCKAGETSSLGASTRMRAYVHQRNDNLNGKLTLLAILAITAGMGIGIGHFVGWSTTKGQQLSMVQVLKLKQLQEDLLVCMQTEDLGQIEETVCKGNSEYWRGRFEALFEENSNLMQILRKSRTHLRENGQQRKAVIEESECTNKSTSDEFHNLRLDFLIKQLEYLELLDKLEEVQSTSRKQINSLQQENLDLKIKLMQEEVDDEEIVHEWQSKFTVLEAENEELRKTFEDDELEDQQLIDGLKEEITLLSRENSELKSVLDQMYNDLVLSQIDNIRAKEHKTFDEFRMISFADIGLDPEYEPVEEETLYRGKYRNLQKRVFKLYTENVELKEKMNYLQKLVKKLEDDAKRQEEAERLAAKTESSFEKKMKSYSNKLAAMQRQLKDEQKETVHWREKYDELRRKQRREYDQASEERRKSEQKQKEQSQSEETFNKLTKATEDTFNELVAKMQTKWNDWNVVGKKKFEESFKKKKANVEKYIKNAFKSVNKYSEKLVYNGIVSSEAIYSYFADRFRDVSLAFSQMQHSRNHDGFQNRKNNHKSEL